MAILVWSITAFWSNVPSEIGGDELIVLVLIVEVVIEEVYIYFVKLNFSQCITKKAVGSAFGISPETILVFIGVGNMKVNEMEVMNKFKFGDEKVDK